jgi:hypothetical protein
MWRPLTLAVLLLLGAHLRQQSLVVLQLLLRSHTTTWTRHLSIWHCILLSTILPLRIRVRQTGHLLLLLLRHLSRGLHLGLWDALSIDLRYSKMTVPGSHWEWRPSLLRELAVHIWMSLAIDLCLLVLRGTIGSAGPLLSRRALLRSTSLHHLPLLSFDHLLAMLTLCFGDL